MWGMSKRDAPLEVPIIFVGSRCRGRVELLACVSSVRYRPCHPQQATGVRNIKRARSSRGEHVISNHDGFERTLGLYGTLAWHASPGRRGGRGASIDVASIAVARSLAPYSLEVHCGRSVCADLSS
jgi:hypothetical protein